MKRFFKDLVAGILGWQLRRLKKHNNFKVIAVAGSIGKTSTKLALAQVLAQGFKVRYQEGNYNDLVTVPLVFFGHLEPSLFNPLAWIWTFLKNERVIGRKYHYQIVVVELGSDAPGQMQQFKKYLRADIGVLTAIVPEHMEFFKDIESVANEELTLANLSARIFANKDLIAPEYLARLPKNTITYGIKQQANVRLSNIKFDGEQATFDIMSGGLNYLHGEHEKVSEPQLYSICAAVAVATELEMTTKGIDQGIRSIKPVSGRMQQLNGLNSSTIIDDSYNASPEAVRGALDTLYRMRASQKIAILGNMNQLGGYSQREHTAIGEYCDPRELSFVATIGPDANKFLAPAAQARGCLVRTFKDPVSAGQFVSQRLQPSTIVLVKGSQDGVYAEEAVKQLLALPADANKLVRQSKYWLKTKHKQFPSVKIN